MTLASVDGAPASEPLSDRVRSLYDYTPSSLLGNGLGMAVMAGLYADTSAFAPVWGWLAAFVVVWLARLGLAVAYRRAAPTDRVACRVWLRRWAVAALATGAMWGAAAGMLYGPGDAVQRTALLMIVTGLCIGSIPSLATQGRVYLGFIALAFVPAIVSVARDPHPRSMWLAALLLLIFATAALLGRNHRATFDRLIDLQAEGRRLMDRLRGQTEAAEAARAQAEAANLAKSRLFAAANHDLRQPLQALGLFVEALRARVQAKEAPPGPADRPAPAPLPSLGPLVDRIGDSVEALDDLFTGLMDVSRIDAGGIEARPRDFAMGDVMRRVRLHFEPVAFDKGLALSMRGANQVVHADPLLVERILRNLLANALRCTRDGGVLVSARRRGDQVLVQVWDSGIGIAPADQSRVFDEFVQLGVPPRDAASEPRRGLGLGLAIVRRLAGLLGTEVGLRSVPGRGSVFGFLLPMGDLARRVAEPETDDEAVATLKGRLVVVVEDDAAVRAGWTHWLESWGASVMAFEGHAAARRWAEAVEPSMVRPDLLMVDAQLEAGHTAADVTHEMRAVFGPDLPVLVVTGDPRALPTASLPGHRVHGLLKPVPPSRLRAMIGHAMAAR